MRKITLLFIVFMVNWQTSAQCPYNVPYFEGFESGYNDLVDISGCLLQNNWRDKFKANNTLTAFNTAPRTGNWNAVLGSPPGTFADAELFIPLNLIAGVNYTVSFFARQDHSNVNYANINTVALATAPNSTSVVMDIKSFEFALNGMYRKYVGSFIPPSSGIYYIMINARKNSQASYISIDDISVVETFTIQNPNDDCLGAISLPIGGDVNSFPVVSDNIDATAGIAGSLDDFTFPAYVGGDVWFRAVVPSSGNLTIETSYNTPSALVDTGLMVYSGNGCDVGSITRLQSNEDISATNRFSKVSLTGRTPGENLYIRVWERGNDLYDTFRISAYDSTLSSDEFDKSSFQAYPNPVKDVLNLSYISEISSVEIYNMLGQKVLSKDIDLTQGQVDMSNLTAGNYMVKVFAGEATTTVKVVKQ